MAEKCMPSGRIVDLGCHSSLPSARCTDWEDEKALIGSGNSVPFFIQPINMSPDGWIGLFALGVNPRDTNGDNCQRIWQQILPMDLVSILFPQ